jgi:hypothetical protein
MKSDIPYLWDAGPDSLLSKDPSGKERQGPTRSVVSPFFGYRVETSLSLRAEIAP